MRRPSVIPICRRPSTKPRRSAGQGAVASEKAGATQPAQSPWTKRISTSHQIPFDEGHERQEAQDRQLGAKEVPLATEAIPERAPERTGEGRGERRRAEDQP
jgi:hypothetical protein